MRGPFTLVTKTLTLTELQWDMVRAAVQEYLDNQDDDLHGYPAGTEEWTEKESTLRAGREAEAKLQEEAQS